MEFIIWRFIYRVGKVTKGEFQTLLKLLNPVAPHITEELWEMMGYNGYLYEQAWPAYEEAKTIESVVEIAVQINGKLCVTVSLSIDAGKEEAIAAGREVVAGKLTGSIIKEIYVPGKIINIVQK